MAVYNITQEQIDRFVFAVHDKNPLHTQKGVVPGTMMLALSEHHARQDGALNHRDEQYACCSAEFMGFVRAGRDLEVTSESPDGTYSVVGKQRGKEVFHATWGRAHDDGMGDTPQKERLLHGSPYEITDQHRDAFFMMMGQSQRLYHSHIGALVAAALLDVGHSLTGTHEGVASRCSFTFNPDDRFLAGGQYAVDLYLSDAKPAAHNMNQYDAEGIVRVGSLTAAHGHFTALHPKELLSLWRARAQESAQKQ